RSLFVGWAPPTDPLARAEDRWAVPTLRRGRDRHDSVSCHANHEPPRRRAPPSTGLFPSHPFGRARLPPSPARPAAPLVSDPMFSIISLTGSALAGRLRLAYGFAWMRHFETL